MPTTKRSRESKDHGDSRKKPSRSMATRSMTRASVSNAVFLTTELLESVLHFLLMKDLLLSQRVCRKWRATVTESKKLQRALFFLPRDPGVYWGLTRGVDGARDRLVQISKDEYVAKQPKDVFISGIVNPLLFRVDVSSCDPVARAARGDNELFWLRPRLHTGPSESWRRMLVVQTAAERVHFYMEKQTDWANPIDADVWYPDRTTANSVMELIEEVEADGDVVR